MGLVLALLLAGCTATSDDATPTASPTATASDVEAAPSPTEPSPTEPGEVATTAATGDRPGRIAAMGDSITTAAFPDVEHLAPVNEELSWATGGPEVGSYLARVREHRPDATGLNVAVPGARVAGAPAQADRVVAAGADLVLFLLGANDVCAAVPPSAEEFGATVRTTLERLAAGLPDATVVVVSIPDVVRLRETLGGDAEAQERWRRIRACPAALGAERTDADLAAFRERQVAFDAAAAQACAAHPRCVTDGGAVAAHRFTAEEVSDVDHFHPSVEGQRRLAQVVWDATWEDVTGGR